MASIDWQPGMRITANRLRAGTPQEWETWLPTWDTTSGLALPSFGNASVTGEFVNFGHLCMGRLEIHFGSTTDFGTAPGGGDNWQFSTPVTASSVNLISGYGELQDSSDSNVRCAVRIRMNTVDTFGMEVSAGRTDGAAVATGGVVDGITPWTWADDDWIRFYFYYQTA